MAKSPQKSQNTDKWPQMQKVPTLIHHDIYHFLWFSVAKKLETGTGKKLTKIGESKQKKEV